MPEIQPSENNNIFNNKTNSNSINRSIILNQDIKINLIDNIDEQPINNFL